MKMADSTDDPIGRPPDDAKREEPEEEPVESTEDQIDTLLTQLAVLAETSPERMEKIQRIKKQIEDGTYYVPAEDLARKILEDLDKKGERTRNQF